MIPALAAMCLWLRNMDHGRKRLRFDGRLAGRWRTRLPASRSPFARSSLAAPLRDSRFEKRPNHSASRCRQPKPDYSEPLIDAPETSGSVRRQLRQEWLCAGEGKMIHLGDPNFVILCRAMS